MTDDTRVPSAFRDALDDPAPPAPPEIEPERDDSGGNEPPLVLQWAVTLLGVTIISALGLGVWIVVFTITVAWAPQWGRYPADLAERVVLGGIAAATVVGCLRQRLGWPWQWWLS